MNLLFLSGMDCPHMSRHLHGPYVDGTVTMALLIGPTQKCSRAAFCPRMVASQCTGNHLLRQPKRARRMTTEISMQDGPRGDTIRVLDILKTVAMNTRITAAGRPLPESLVCNVPSPRTVSYKYPGKTLLIAKNVLRAVVWVVRRAARYSSCFMWSAYAFPEWLNIKY